MAVTEITIEKWRPARLNEFVGKHWSMGAKLKKLDRTIVFAHSTTKPKAEEKRRVDVHMVLGPRQKESDPDSRWKSLLDALVFSKMLIDDTGMYVQLGDVTYSRGEPKTIITLTDM